MMFIIVMSAAFLAAETFLKVVMAYPIQTTAPMRRVAGVFGMGTAVLVSPTLGVFTPAAILEVKQHAMTQAAAAGTSSVGAVYTETAVIYPTHGSANIPQAVIVCGPALATLILA